jgi:hypothetical protein
METRSAHRNRHHTALVVAVLAVGSLWSPAVTQAQEADAARSYRVVDLGLRPVFSFPEVLGIHAEIHPLGGGLTLDAGAGFSPIQSLTWNAGIKYRFRVYTGELVHVAVGPGLGLHWLFERDSPITGILLAGFAAAEAVWWGDGVGFRLGLDLGVAHPILDEPMYGDLDTYPVFNGSVGVAFRTAPSRAAGAPRLNLLRR